MFFNLQFGVKLLSFVVKMFFPSVLGHCWQDERRDIWLVKICYRSLQKLLGNLAYTEVTEEN